MTDRPQESDIAFIRALAELLRETDLTEIEVNRELGDDSSLTVRVARQIAMAAPSPRMSPCRRRDGGAGPARPRRGGRGASGRSGRGSWVVASDGRHGLSAGGARLVPFVEARRHGGRGPDDPDHRGDEDDEPDPAPRAGRVKRILVEDGSPVEFGAPLIILE